MSNFNLGDKVIILKGEHKGEIGYVTVQQAYGVKKYIINQGELIHIKGAPKPDRLSGWYLATEIAHCTILTEILYS